MMHLHQIGHIFLAQSSICAEHALKIAWQKQTCVKHIDISFFSQFRLWALVDQGHCFRYAHENLMIAQLGEIHAFMNMFGANLFYAKIFKCTFGANG